MIIHMWMHWFWITTAYFKGFLYFTTQTISLSCIPFSRIAEAGLLANETIPVTVNPFRGNDSSQPGQDSNITSPPFTEERSHPQTITPHLLSSSSPQEETNTEEPTTSKPEDGFRTAFSSTSDLEDIYSGGTLDVFQYPLKKFTKYSHLKFGKVKPKGKTIEEAGGGEHKVESVKVVEEKVSINISMGGGSRSGPEVDKSSDRPFEGNASEVPTSDVPDLITTTLVVENVTAEEGGFGNETLRNASKEETNVRGSPSATSEEQREGEVLKNETLVIENKVEESGTFTTVEPFAVQNRVAAATSAQNYEVEQSEMNAGSITGITLGILVVFSLFGAVSFVLYRRRYLNKPQVLHDKCSNLDSSGYIDETSLRENSEEMYSLDNDSFLNSLEAMTIQNYWTESVKHTKL